MMAVPLPLGVTTVEAQTIFDEIYQKANDLRQKFIDRRMAPYIRSSVTPGNPLPTGMDGYEQYSYINDLSTQAANQFITDIQRFTPSYLLPNVGDYIPPTSQEVTNWLTTMYLRGFPPPDPGRMKAIDKCISTLKANGILQVLDRLWLFANYNASAALVDFKFSALCNPINSPVFTVDRGFKGDGVSAYIDTQFNATQGGNFSQNNAGHGVWITQAVPNNVAISNDNGSYSRFYVNGLTTASLEMNQGVSSPYYNRQSLAGFAHGQRTGAAATAAYGAGGGQEFSSTIASGPLPNHNHFILAAPLANNSPSLFCAHQLAAAWIGASLSVANIKILHNTIKQYLVDIGYDEVSQYVDAVTAMGGTVSTARQSLMRTLVGNLKSWGVWSLLDRLWLFAGENANAALVDLVSLCSAVPVNSPVFTANRGYQGDGVASYLDSQFNYQTAGINFTYPSAGWGVWVETNGVGALMAHENGSYSRLTHPNAVVIEGECLAAVGSASFAPPSMLGYTHVERTGPNNGAVYSLYGNLAQAVTTPANMGGGRSFYILANNYPTGNPSGWSNCRIAAAWAGGPLGAQNATLWNALRPYLTAVGVA